MKYEINDVIAVRDNGHIKIGRIKSAMTSTGPFIIESANDPGLIVNPEDVIGIMPDNFERWTVLDIHPAGGAYVICRPTSEAAAREYVQLVLDLRGPNDYGYTVEAMPVAEALRRPHVVGLEYLKEQETI